MCDQCRCVTFCGRHLPKAQLLTHPHSAEGTRKSRFCEYWERRSGTPEPRLFPVKARLSNPRRPRVKPRSSRTQLQSGQLDKSQCEQVFGKKWHPDQGQFYNCRLHFARKFCMVFEKKICALNRVQTKCRKSQHIGSKRCLGKRDPEQGERDKFCDTEILLTLSWITVLCTDARMPFDNWII